MPFLPPIRACWSVCALRLMPFITDETWPMQFQPQHDKDRQRIMLGKPLIGYAGIYTDKAGLSTLGVTHNFCSMVDEK